MIQIDDNTLRCVIRYELGRIAKSTLRDMAAGHQGTRDNGLNIATSRLLDRMRDWEILVPEPAGNIFETIAVLSPRDGS